MFERRQLVGDIGAGLIGTILLAIAGAASTVVLARLLPVEEFGKVSVLLLAFNLTSTFDAVRPVTIYFANRFANKPRETFASIFWIDAGIGGVLGVILISASLFVPQNFFKMTELLCLAGVFVLFFMQSAYWGWADAHGFVARTSLVRSFIMIFVYVAFVALAAGGVRGVGYALVLVLATAAILIAFWWLCRCGNIVTKVAWPEMFIMRAIGTEVRRYMQFNFSTLLLATADRIAITVYGDSRSLGLYSGHFDLATKPMVLARAVVSALNPHITRAAACKSDVFSSVGFGTKCGFVVVSLAVWGSMILREWITGTLLGPEYSSYQDVFAPLVLAQCFVILGYTSALLLNSVGNFRLQKAHYLIAAVMMVLLVFPAAQFAGLFGVAVIYLIIRTVDLWLLHAALRVVSRQIIPVKVLVVATIWCSASFAAWLREALICFVCSTLFVVLLLRWKLTKRFYHQSDDLAVIK